MPWLMSPLCTLAAYRCLLILIATKRNNEDESLSVYISVFSRFMSLGVRRYAVVSLSLHPLTPSSPAFVILRGDS